MAKRFYWLKLKEDFFYQKEIKKLRKFENGDTCVIIYQKMLILSLKTENKLFFNNVEDTFSEELALDIDEDVENVKRTLEFLERVNLIEKIDDYEYSLPQGSDLTGSESDSTQRVKKHRANKKKEAEKVTSITEEIVPITEEILPNKEKAFFNTEEIDCNSENNLCNKNVTLEKEKEIDLEEDIDIDTETKTETYTNTDNNSSEGIEGKNTLVSEYVGKCVDDNFAKIVRLYEQNIGPVYPANRDWFIEVSEKIEPALFSKAIEICIDRSNVTPSYLKGIIRKWTSNKIFTLDMLKSKEIEAKNRNNVTPFNREFSQNTSQNNFNSSRIKSREYEVKDDEEIDPKLLEELRTLEMKLGV